MEEGAPNKGLILQKEQWRSFIEDTLQGKQILWSWLNKITKTVKLFYVESE